MKTKLSIPTHNFQKDMHYSNQKMFQNDSICIVDMLEKIIQKVDGLTQRDLEIDVKYRQKSFLCQFGINLNAFHNVSCLKFILLNLIDQLKKLELHCGALQQNRHLSNIAQKKTNISIDFDMSQFLQKMNKREENIQMLKEMILSKENQIQILSKQKAKLKNRINQQLQTYKNFKQENEKLRQDFGILSTLNQSLKQEIQKLIENNRFVRASNKEQVNQFYQRCLLSQALGIEHFISYQKEEI